MQDKIQEETSQELHFSQTRFGNIFNRTLQTLPVVPDNEFLPVLQDCSASSMEADENFDNNSDELMPPPPPLQHHPSIDNIPEPEPVSAPESQVPLNTKASQIAYSSLPACNNWPGENGFDIYFGPQDKPTKSSAWVYSEMKDKLYVAKGAPCQLKFVTDCPMPSDTTIRVMSIFIQSEHSSDIVRRCVNHMFVDRKNGVRAPEHLIRCECLPVSYQIDRLTGRQSVVVPFENHDDGESFSTYIFKFMCFGSCPGGLNRRQIKVIFTLERGNKVYGRRSLEVKICACPGRDIMKDERQETVLDNVEKPLSLMASQKRKHNDEPLTHLSNVFQFVRGISYPPAKVQKTASKGDRIYTITVYDREEYEFLNQMKRMYEMSQLLRKASPEFIRALQHGMHKNMKRKEN